MTNSERVAEFHRAMGFPVRDHVDLGTDSERALRMRLISEEQRELFDALAA